MGKKDKDSCDENDGNFVLEVLVDVKGMGRKGRC